MTAAPSPTAVAPTAAALVAQNAAGVPLDVAKPGVLARILMLPIRAWRVVSAFLPPRCRFYPSCSQYALDALRIHGAAKGSWLAVRRVGRCHPWHDGGVDPVPDARPNIRSLDAATVRAAEES